MKNKLDLKNWKEFRIGDLFDIHPTKAYKMNNSSLLDENGVNPVVVNSSYNNGIGGYTNEKCTEKGNMITFSDTTTAESIFYQEHDFVGYPHVQGLYPIGKYQEKWTKNRYLFFVTIFREKAKNLNYDYINKFTRESAKEINIKLPAYDDGTINWNYIDSYMASIEYNSQNSVCGLKKIKNNKREVKNDNWKEYKVGDLFNIESPKVYHTREVKEDSNGIPYVVRSKYNNGMKYRIKKDDELVLNPKNVITFGAENASFFYQEEEYVSGRDMYYIDTSSISKNAAFFLLTCLGTITSKYSYNFGLFPKLLKEEQIKLPSKKDGTPDYDLMDKYIENIKKTALKKIKLLKNL